MKTAIAISALVMAAITAVGMLGGALVATAISPDEGEQAALSSRNGGAGRQPRADQANLALGRSVYRQYCARCHRNDARGYIGPSLVGLRFRRNTIESIVRQGPGLMPAFGNILSTEQIEAVAAYVASLGSGSRIAEPSGTQPSPVQPTPQAAPVQWGPMCPMMGPVWQGSQT